MCLICMCEFLLDVREQVELAEMLVLANQIHLFEHWPEPGVEDDEKRVLFDQVCFTENYGSSCNYLTVLLVIGHVLIC